MTDEILDSILPAAMANVRQEAEEIALYPEMVNGLLRQCADDDEICATTPIGCLPCYPTPPRTMGPCATGWWRLF